jgi:hypothetical protein
MWDSILLAYADRSRVIPPDYRRLGWTTSPARRIQWTSGVTEVAEDLAGGRRGIGTVNHCAHGKNVSIEEVLDWVPPEYETKRIIRRLLDADPDDLEALRRVGRGRVADRRRLGLAGRAPEEGRAPGVRGPLDRTESLPLGGRVCASGGLGARPRTTRPSSPRQTGAAGFSA